MMISVAALQFPLGGEITLDDRLHLIRHRPDFVCLPEYFFVRPTDQHYADGDGRIGEQIETLARLSRDLSCVVIGGTMAHPIDGGYANIATVFNRGVEIGSYQKMNPYGREETRGIIPGNEFKIFEVEGVRLGVLICADVLQPDSFAGMAEMAADVIVVPTVSPYREGDTVFEKDRRDVSIFVSGAQRAMAFVVKTCGVGTIFGGRLQGRSGIYAPWGILQRVPPNEESKKQILFEYLDIAEIREFRQMMSREALDSPPIPAVPEIAQHASR
ncbi:MAG: carbon-nitrogen hydrolase family protein [candidate division Zixibacteria bacterium]|nr:carbon-nitrogen hydrolase family protein [candidate division Zixibacteria bacterium]